MTDEMIRQVCPGCGAASQVPARLAGAVLLCSGCGSDVGVSMPTRPRLLGGLRTAGIVSVALSLLFIAFISTAWHLNGVARDDLLGDWEGTRVVDGQPSRMRLELRPDNTFYLRVRPEAERIAGGTDGGNDGGDVGAPPGAGWMDGRWEMNGQSLIFHVARSSAGVDPDPEFVWDVNSADRASMTTDTSAGQQLWQRAAQVQVTDVSDVSDP